MFTNISWSSYIITVTVLLAGYYLFIALHFYRSDLLQIFSGKKFPGGLTSHQADLQQAFEKQEAFQITQTLSDEIRAFLNQAARDTLNKKDVIQSLKSLIAKYPSVKNSAFREVIQDLIITTCETNCSIHLSGEELSELW